ncbi:MAG: hypothetical protein KBG17_09400 [Paludibacteraceae bacterium]|nr:hypothetical protein [Paludibacteraceae bacterium]
MTQLDSTLPFAEELLLRANIEYPEKDKEKATAQCAVFVFMTDSIPVATNNGTVIHTPFTYNFDDFAAQKEFKSTFFLFFVSLPLFGVASRQRRVKNKISRFSILPFSKRIRLDFGVIFLIMKVVNK